MSAAEWSLATEKSKEARLCVGTVGLLKFRDSKKAWRAYLRFSGESARTKVVEAKRGIGTDDAGGNGDLRGASGDVPGASLLVHSLRPADRRLWHWHLHPCAPATANSGVCLERR